MVDDDGEQWWYQDVREGVARGREMGNLLHFKFSEEVNLRVVAEAWPPHIEEVTDPLTKERTFKGPMVKVLQAFAESLNFTFTMVQGDGFFGAPQDDGTFNGMIGMAQRHEVDIALGPFAITYSRSKAVDFSNPLFMERMRILMLRPQVMPNAWGLVAPFSPSVWVGILLGVAFVLVMMTWISWIWKFRKGNTTMDVGLLVFIILLRQDLPWDPSKTSLRLCLITLMMVTIIITNSYGGALTSQLAVRRLEAKYETLQQLVDDPDINFVMEGSTALTSYMKAVERGIYKDFASAAVTRGRQLKMTELWETAKMVLTGPSHVMVAEEYTVKKFMAEHVTELGTCNLYMSKGSFFPIIVATALPKGSPLLPLFNARILMFREYFIYDDWLSKALQNSSLCLQPLSSGELKPHSLADLKGAFLAMSLGLAAAFISFLFEMWKSRDRSTRASSPRGRANERALFIRRNNSIRY